MPVQARLLERQGTGSQRRYEAADERKRLQKLEPFFVVSKHRANCIFHKFTFSTWLQQILILGDNSHEEKRNVPYNYRRGDSHAPPLAGQG